MLLHCLLSLYLFYITAAWLMESCCTQQSLLRHLLKSPKSLGFFVLLLAIFGRHICATSTRVGPLWLLRGGWLWKLLHVDFILPASTYSPSRTTSGLLAIPQDISRTKQVSTHPPLPAFSSSAEIREPAHP